VKSQEGIDERGCIAWGPTGGGDRVGEDAPG